MFVSSLKAYCPSFLSNIASYAHEHPISSALIGVSSASLALIAKPTWRWGANTLCMQASREEKWSYVKFLVASGADINAEDQWGQTPILRAAGKSNWEVVLDLAKIGGNLDLLDDTGKAPIHHAALEAARYGGWDVVFQLIEAGADIDLRDDLGRTPLHIAALVNRDDIGKSLIERGADTTPTGNAQLDEPIQSWQNEIEFAKWTGVICTVAGH